MKTETTEEEKKRKKEEEDAEWLRRYPPSCEYQEDHGADFEF